MSVRADIHVKRLCHECRPLGHSPRLASPTAPAARTARDSRLDSTRADAGIRAQTERKGQQRRMRKSRGRSSNYSIVSVLCATALSVRLFKQQPSAVGRQDRKRRQRATGARTGHLSTLLVVVCVPLAVSCCLAGRWCLVLAVGCFATGAWATDWWLTALACATPQGKRRAEYKLHESVVQYGISFFVKFLFNLSVFYACSERFG